MVTDLRLRSELERLFGDAEYRAALAKHKTEEVLKEKPKFASEYRQIMADPELVSMLKEQAPEVLEWLKARHEIILLAEQIQAIPPPSPPPKRKPTEEEIRDRIRHRVQRAARDEIARKTGVFDVVKEFEVELEKKYGLDEDERHKYTSELADELLRDDGNEGKKIE